MRWLEPRTGRLRRPHQDGCGGTFSSLATGSPSPRHILRNGGLADVDTELEEFSMNAGSAPERIGEAHLPDQPPDFRRHARPTGTPTRFPAPEGAKACPMPPDNGFRLYDREGVQNTRRDPSPPRIGRDCKPPTS